MSDTDTSVPEFPTPDPQWEAPADAVASGDPITAPAEAPEAEVAQVPGDADAVAAANAAGPPAKKEKAKPSNLEGDLKHVVDEFVLGHIKFEGNGPTPHNLARAVEEYRKSVNPNDTTKVSSGAVSAAFARWKEIGMATLSDTKPLTFVDWTEAGRQLGLTELKKLYSSKKSEEKAAVKAANAPVQQTLPDTTPDVPQAAPTEPVEGFIPPDHNS